MNDLLRGMAPIPDEAWAAIDSEAQRTLRPFLAARRLVDFKGPLGWTAASVELGRATPLAAHPLDGVRAELRQVQPLVEFHTDFALPRRELEDVARGLRAPDLRPLGEAARLAALAEDRAVFHGYAAGGIRGITEGSPHDRISIPKDYERYPALVAQATSTLRGEGVDGPFALALGPRCYTGLMQTMNRGGFPVYEDVRRLLDGPMVWAPAVDGAVLLSTRGGDFELVSGRDLSIAYRSHDASSVQLSLVESFTFSLLGPEAAVRLVYG